MELCRIWGKLRYRHPWIVTGRVDWDAALVAAIPKIEAAKTDAEEERAIAEMLASIGDPATRLERPSAPPAPAGADALRWVDRTLVIDASSITDAKKISGALPDEVAKASALVVDLRGPSPDPEAREEVLTALSALLPSRALVEPRQHSITYSGYPSQFPGAGSPSYTVTFESDPPRTFPAAKGPRPKRVAFLVDADSYLPTFALALQRAGEAQILGAGPVTDDIVTWSDTLPRRRGPAVIFRVTDLDEPFEIDASLPKGSRGDALDAAIALLKKPPRPRVSRPAQAAASEIGRDKVYAESPYPSRELRILALFRFWNVLHHFYPYLHLMGDSWDRALVELLPRFEAAGDARAYGLAIAELSARLADGHVNTMGSAALDELFPRSALPITVQRIDGLPVVTAKREDAPSGIEVGDVIVSVDGEDLDARAARLAPYRSDATPGATAFMRDRFALGGPPGSTAKLRVRGAGDAVREVSVPRVKGPPPQSARPAFEVLSSGFGYVDMMRLEPSQVDAMFAALGQTPGIVFDVRGYPRGAVWQIAPRLADRDDKPMALFRRSLVSRRGEGVFEFVQRLPPASGPRYRGPTVMLIDERAISHAEHTGLLLEAANGTKFVGSPTQGSNGDVTVTCLPGNVCVSFTGHDVRHADGRQLQRIGLVPDVPVRPTIQGLRAGKDEVLERAVEVLRAAVGKRP